MSYVEEGAWIRQRLETGWAARTPLYWDATATGAEDGDWIRAAIRGSGSDIRDIATAPSYEYTGALVVEVFGQTARGEGYVLEHVDVLVELFRGAFGPGIQFGSPYMLNMGEVDGVWHKRDVICPFTREET